MIPRESLGWLLAQDLPLAIEVCGWLGQGLFFSRFLIQWFRSERAGRIVVPHLFWWLSLLGALFALVYAFAKGNVVFLAGPAVNSLVYIRNLSIARVGTGLRKDSLWAFAGGILLMSGLSLLVWLREKPGPGDPWPWLLVGAAGQTLWVLRFPLQWWIAEHRREAVLPPIFFDVSLAGCILLLAYAIHTEDPVFIAGMVPTPILYGRSAWLSRRPKSKEAVAEVSR